MDMLNWAINELMVRKIVPISAPENVQDTEWSRVVQIGTNKGIVYLKKTPPTLSLEPRITAFLHDQLHESVPEIIAINNAMHCFLSFDCGVPLRKIFDGTLQPAVLAKGIKNYTAIQSVAVAHVDMLLDWGIPDWRLIKLPGLFRDLLNRDALLIQDGLTTEELQTLETLVPLCKEQCDLLATFGVSETLDHCDFHDNNMVMDASGRISIIDWAECAITHPLFSLTTCLYAAQRRYKLEENGSDYQLLQDACLAGGLFSRCTSSEKLEMLRVAKMLSPVYAALAQFRLLQSCSDDIELSNISEQRRGRLAGILRTYLKACQSQ
ncbi:MAG: aminoglycoside phosphotransferase family protein [Pseudomonadota bacterium]